MLDEARASDTEGQHRATPRKLADERRRRSHEADAKLQQTRNNQSQCKSRLWSKPSQLQISYPPAVGMSQISYPAEKGIPPYACFPAWKGARMRLCTRPARLRSLVSQLCLIPARPLAPLKSGSWGPREGPLKISYPCQKSYPRGVKIPYPCQWSYQLGCAEAGVLERVSWGPRERPPR